MNITISRQTQIDWTALNLIITRKLMSFILFLAIVFFGIGTAAVIVITRPPRDFDNSITPANFGLSYQDVRFPSRGSKLEIAGWFIPNDDSDKAIILVHGLSASRTAAVSGNFVELGAALNQEGFNVLMIDLRGHGQSDKGNVTFGIEERYDVLGAVDWLKQEGFQSGNIGALGISLGGASSIGAAAEDSSIGALIVDSTFADFDLVLQDSWSSQTKTPELFLPSFMMMNQLINNYQISSARPIDEIGAIDSHNVLIIHCTTDSTVPISQAEALSNKVPDAQTWFVDGCSHAETYRENPEVYEDQVTAFFSEHLNN